MSKPRKIALKSQPDVKPAAKRMGITSRQYKEMKRRQLKQVEKALDAYSMGSAYSPAWDETSKIRGLLKEAIRKQSVKEWGR